MHPTDTRRLNGRLYHLEDSNLTLVEAKALAKHLRQTEDKRAVRRKQPDGKYEVWWSR